MTDETSTAAAAPAAAVPAHIIPAALPHPNISSPLARGVSYLHHFEILLVSDGQRLWDAASAEGQQVLADIKGEQAAHADTIAAAKAAPPVQAPQQSQNALNPSAAPQPAVQEVTSAASIDPTKPAT